MLARSCRTVIAGLVALAAVALGLAVGAPTADAATGRSLGRTASHHHFTITVGNVIRDDAQGTLVYAQVCVRALPPGSTGGRTRVSWDPWRLTTTRGTVQPRLYDGSHPPENLFPHSVRVAEGDCTGGFLPFSTAEGRVTKITYHNSLGETSTWVAPPKSADTSYGTTRHFAHLTVKVTKTKVDGAWGGAYVRTCVTSRPAGVTGKVLLTQRPWTVTTNHGVITTLIMQEGVPDFPGHGEHRTGLPGTRIPLADQGDPGQLRPGLGLLPPRLLPERDQDQPGQLPQQPGQPGRLGEDRVAG